MKIISVCLDCGNTLPLTQNQCQCGWKRPEPQNTGDKRCAYILDDHRCPLPGTVCAHPYGKGPWYCSGHWQARDSKLAGEAVLRWAEANYAPMVTKRLNKAASNIDPKTN